MKKQKNTVREEEQTQSIGISMEMIQMIELVHKCMKTVTSTPLYIFKQIEERWSIVCGDIEDFERFRSRFLFFVLERIYPPPKKN